MIEKRRGLGTFVREDAPVIGMKKDMLHQAANAYADEGRQLDASIQEAIAVLKEVWDVG
ncbi:hypothetical protein IH601_03360 [Candidatus Bipolaricaulota bacterium]|nr:hypothetical protein [Candidatus Bipolaricaulota bacterium]